MITLQWTLTLAVIGGMALVLASRWPQLQKLFTFSAGTVVAIGIGTLALFVFSGLVLQALARPFHLHLPFTEAFVIALVDATLNYLPLKAGTVATGAILWSRHRLAPTKFAAMIAGTSILGMWVSTTLGSALLIVRGVAVGWAWALLIVPTLGVAFLLVWGLGFEGHMADTEHAHWLVRTVNRVLDGVRAIFADVTLVVLMIVYSVARVVIVALQLMVAFRAVSTPIDLSTALIMSSLATALSTLSIIPGGLGFREGGVAGVAALLGIPATVGLAASLIERTVTVVITAVCGIPATIYVSRTASWSMLMRGAEQEQEA
jgi:uncharacterized membrane protein YbhN (UPF0104 family)